MKRRETEREVPSPDLVEAVTIRVLLSSEKSTAMEVPTWQAMRKARKMVVFDDPKPAMSCKLSNPFNRLLRELSERFWLLLQLPFFPFLAFRMEAGLYIP
jgi:hypothetical protein